MFSYSDASVTSKVGRDTYLRPEEGPLPEEKARKREDRSGERKEGIPFLVTVVIFNYSLACLSRVSTMEKSLTPVRCNGDTFVRSTDEILFPRLPPRL